MSGPKIGASVASDPFLDDDDEGWQDMPVVRDEFAGGLDDEDRRKFHYVTPQKQETTNATGNLIDFDDRGNEWREKLSTNESEYTEYTRLRLNEENDNDEVHLRTRFLFDEDKAMTPLSQMQATKDMLSESQRIAYVGLCALIVKEMARSFRLAKKKELKPALESLELWSLKIMGRLFYHMELETAEQKMIDSLAEHGVQASDLVPSLMTTRTVANPEYDPLEGRKQQIEQQEAEFAKGELEAEDITDDIVTPKLSPGLPKTPQTPATPTAPYQTTANVLPPSVQEPLPGVSTSLSTADKDVTLDVRWTILCDLFLILIADSVYDARSRVLLESVAYKLGLGWLDVAKFEERVTEALEIQEGVEKLEQQDVIEGRVKAAKKRRYAMLGLATLGGGLVIGLSAGLLAPVIGAGLGAAFTTVGITGTSAFLAGTGGAAVITTAGTLTGSSIALKGMARRTKDITTFDILPLHNNKRVNCILTVSGFMTSHKDDVRLPFSVLDPVVGDVFSALWEPQMLGETGSVFKILTSEVLSQVGQTVLQATVMTALMSALQWPILLTKLGYLIDNPWFNALDRARAAGLVLADVLKRRHLGVRPISLIGFSLGARVIFYCLLELAKQKAFGIVQDVFLLGATITAPQSSWLQARSVVSGRFVNAFARNDWVLNYLFRASTGGLHTVAGLRPVLDIPGLENVDVTDKIAGHMSYRAFMPLILDQLGFPVSADYFNEPEEPDMKSDREVIREGDASRKKSWFSRRGSKKDAIVSRPPSRPPTAVSSGLASPRKSVEKVSTISQEDDDLPERLDFAQTAHSSIVPSPIQSPPINPRDNANSPGPTPIKFDFAAMQRVIVSSGGPAQADEDLLHAPIAQIPQAAASLAQVHEPSGRAESAPPPIPTKGASDVFVPIKSKHVRPTSIRERAASTPLSGGSGEFQEEWDQEDEEEIAQNVRVGEVEVTGIQSFSFSTNTESDVGASSGAERYLSSAFAHSVSLEPNRGASGSSSQIHARPGAASATEHRPDLAWNNVGYGTMFGGSSAGGGWLSANTSTGRMAPQESSLNSGGPDGSVWNASTASSLNTSMPSLSVGPSKSSESTLYSPPPSLPADILNPFAISSRFSNKGESGGGGVGWSPPPLTTKSSTTNASTNVAPGKNTPATRSTFNINMNPWG